MMANVLTSEPNRRRELTYSCLILIKSSIKQSMSRERLGQIMEELFCESYYRLQILHKIYWLVIIFLAVKSEDRQIMS